MRPQERLQAILEGDEGEQERESGFEEGRDLIPPPLTSQTTLRWSQPASLDLYSTTRQTETLEAPISLLSTAFLPTSRPSSRNPP